MTRVLALMGVAFCLGIAAAVAVLILADYRKQRRQTP